MGGRARVPDITDMGRIMARKSMALLAGLGTLAMGLAGLSGAALAAKAVPWQLGLPEPVTPLARDMLSFHNDWLMPIITVITIFVLILLIYVCVRFRESANPVPSKTTHNTLLEIVWIGIPSLILIVLAFPSLSLLYATDDPANVDLQERYADFDGEEITVKIIGHQWFWEYQYPDNGNFLIEARIAARTHEEAEEMGVERLMATDEVIYFPTDTVIRLQFTSADVLHNWSLSDFGVRMDTVPGRLNQAWTYIEEPGDYYGFCSELCGIDHAFMPIHIRAVERDEFETWAAGAVDQYYPVEEAAAPGQGTDLAVVPAAQ